MGCCKCESQAQVCQGGETERHKHRNLTEEKDLLKRLNRIEGQVRGCEGDGGRRAILRRYYKPGISDSGGAEQFFQSPATTISKPVWSMYRGGNGEEAIEELCKTIQKLMK